MSLNLIAPIYAEVRRQGQQLALANAKEIAYAVLLGLTEADGPWLQEWLSNNTNMSGYNQVVLDDEMWSAVAVLHGPVQAISGSLTAASAVVNVPERVAGLYESALWRQAIAENAPISQAIATSDIALVVLLDSVAGRESVLSAPITMAAVAASPSAWSILLESAAWRSEMAASETAMGAVFDSVIAKRAVFESEAAELAIRGSETAMLVAAARAVTASADVVRAEASAPPPLNTNGKWFIVSCTRIYPTGTYNRSIANYRHGTPSFSGSWGNYSFSNVGMPSPWNVLPPAGVDADSSRESLQGRFFTQVAVMTLDGSTSSSTMTFTYINMDAEGSA